MSSEHHCCSFGHLLVKCSTLKHRNHCLVHTTTHVYTYCRSSKFVVQLWNDHVDDAASRWFVARENLLKQNHYLPFFTPGRRAFGELPISSNVFLIAQSVNHSPQKSTQLHLVVDKHSCWLPRLPPPSLLLLLFSFLIKICGYSHYVWSMCTYCTICMGYWVCSENWCETLLCCQIQMCTVQMHTTAD